MQNCPFCRFDCEDHALQEGRCPRCGGIVQWIDGLHDESLSEGTAADTSSESVAALSSTPETPRGLDSRTDAVLPLSGAVPESGFYNRSDEASSSSRSEEEADRVPARSEEPPSSTEPPIGFNIPPDRGDRSADSSVVESLWRKSLIGTQDARSTIKGSAGQASEAMHDTVFSIQTRAIRQATPFDPEPIDYELIDLIGKGGVGVVYSGRQASIDRNVAIKMLRDEYRDHPDHRDKFLAEAVLTGELDHPNIVPIYDLGRSPDGELFYSMKNVIGTPWNRVIVDKTLRENLDILLKVGDAVAFAHSRGILHRDLKPENVMLGSYGEVLVMDWGLALPTAEFRKSASILRSQAMGGTPAYMAPEMAQGPVERVTVASDVYLLGAILFEILTGHPPHDGNDVMHCVKNAAKNVIRASDVTGELMDIAKIAMSTLPRRRYRTVKDFQGALRLYLSHSESITLSDNAEKELDGAIEEQSYPRFSRAVFAFEEALSLWDENYPAREGIVKAKAAYAAAALQKGDIDLGISILDEKERGHSELLNRLKDAQRERNSRNARLQTIKRFAGLLVAFILTAGSVAMIYISQLNAGLKQASADLELEIKQTEKAKQEAEDNSEKAVQQAAIAERRKDEAQEARRVAEESRVESVSQKQKAEESAYFAEARLIGASLEQNGFTAAAEVLDRQRVSPAKSKLRHWEWGRFHYLIHGGSNRDGRPVVTTHATPDTVEAIDCSPTGKWIAVGLNSGECEIWRQGEAQPMARLRHGKSLRDIDFDATGNFLAMCGADDEIRGSVSIWRMQDDAAPQLEQRLEVADALPECVAFCNAPAGDRIAVGDNRRIARVWSRATGKPISMMLGHMDTVSELQFSPNDRWVVTGCVDTTARVFDSISGSEVQRFTSHRMPIATVNFTPSGKQIASADADGNIFIWKLNPIADPARRQSELKKQVEGQGSTEESFQRRQGHTGAVYDLRFSPDGSLMVSGGADNVVCIWKTEGEATAQDSLAQAFMEKRGVQSSDGGPILKLRGHGGWVRSASFTQDGMQVVSGAADRTWKSWNLFDYSEVERLGNSEVAVLDSVISPDGRAISAAGQDGLIEVYDIESGKRKATLTEGHEYLTNRALILPDNQRLLTVAGDNSIRLWDLRHGTQTAAVKNAGRNSAFSVTPDGKWLLAGGDEVGAAICELDTIESIRRFRSRDDQAGKDKSSSLSDPTAVALTDDAKHALIGTREGLLEFWDPQNGTLLSKVTGHGQSVVAAYALPAAGPEFLTISTDGTVAWWNGSTGKELERKRLNHQSRVQACALSADRRYLACNSVPDKGIARIWLWDLSDGKLVRQLDMKDVSVQDLAFEGNRFDHILVTTSDLSTATKNVLRWEPNPDNKTSAVFDETLGSRLITGAVWGVNTSRDGNWMVIYGGKGARLWDTQLRQEVMNYRPSSAVFSLAYSPDGRTLAAGNEDGSITLWDMQSHRALTKLTEGHRRAVSALDFSADGKGLLSTGADGRVTLWDWEKGIAKDGGRFGKSFVSGTAVRYAPDGKTFLIAADDELIRIHAVDSMNQIKVLSGHVGAVTCADFSPDGRWIVSGGQDKSIRVWDTASGRQLSELIGHSAPISSVTFSRDRLRVLSSSLDSTAKLWDLEGLEAAESKTSDTAGTKQTDVGEILSLAVPSDPMTRARVTPSGHAIVTSGSSGRVYLWRADYVPPSLRLSYPVLNVIPDGRVLRLDSQMVLSNPFEGLARQLKLRVSIDSSAPSVSERVSQKLSIQPTDEGLAIEGDSVSSVGIDGKQQPIGKLVAVGDDRIEIEFNEGIAVWQMLRVLRSLAYQATLRSGEEKETQELVPSAIRLELTDAEGKGGNFTPEVLAVQFQKPESKSSESK